jgi:hypothetical protein
MKITRFLVSLAFGVTLWSADPAIGTWKLNTAKSRYFPGPAPKSATIVYEETPGGIKRTGESIDADGNRTSFEYTAKYDGKDYPVSGSELFDAIALTRFNDHTVESTLKKSGKVVTTARRFVPKDGKTMTFTISGTNVKGRKMQNFAVYERK